MELVDAGTHPNTALAKVAGEKHLPAGHVQLLVQAYNTGRVNHRRKTASTLLERTEPFALADADAILEQLYPSKIKSAAARPAPSAEISTEYSTPFVAPPRSSEPACTFLKTASVGPPPVPPAERDDDFRRAYNALRDHRVLMGQVEVEVEAAWQKLAAALDKLEHTVRYGGFPGYEDALEQLELGYGDPARILIKHLRSWHGQAMSKTASARSRVLTDMTRGPATLLVDCVQALIKYAAVRARHKELAEHDGTARLEKLLFPVKQAADDASSPPGPASSFGQGFNLIRDKVTTPFSNWAVKPPDKRTADDVALEELTSPDHEAELDGIRTRALLHDMMANDPVISTHEPEVVLSVFNDLRSLAPNMARQPAVVRALLRRHLAQGGLDTHELSQLNEMENKMVSSRTPDSGGTAARPVAAKRKYQKLLPAGK
jgi:hypothetical protein